jgi:hypothetical protein
MKAHRPSQVAATTFAARSTRRTAIGATAALGASLLGASPALGQATPAASPAAGDEAGLGLWSEQLTALAPDEITRLLLEKVVAPVGYNEGLVAAETDYSSDPDFFFPDKPVHEVSLGFESDGDFEIGSGLFLIYADATTAARNLQTIAPGEEDDTTTWAIPFAGLDGRWQVHGNRSVIYLQAGSVILVGTDELLAIAARTHLMNSIGWVLKNIDHVLFHLYSATDEALGID